MHGNASISKNLLCWSSQAWKLKRIIIQLLSFSLQTIPQPPQTSKNRQGKHWPLPVLSVPLNLSLSVSPLMFKLSGEYDLTVIFLNESNHILFHEWIAYLSRLTERCMRQHATQIQPISDHRTSSPHIPTQLLSGLHTNAQNRTKQAHTHVHTHTSMLMHLSSA